MTTSHFHGCIVISGGRFIRSNPTIHYNSPGLQSPTSVDPNARGPTGAHEAHFSSPNSPIPHVSPSMVNTSPPTARPQRSFPRSFSLDSDYYPGWETPSSPTGRQRSSTLPLSSFDSSSPGVVYGFRLQTQRDSLVPFQPIGNPEQYQPIPEQREFFRPIENTFQNQPVPRQLGRDQPSRPMPQAHILESQPTSPVVWGGSPIKGYGIMPMPQHQSTVFSTPQPFDDREIDTTDDMDQSHDLDQTY